MSPAEFRAARKALGLTHRALAAVLHVDPATVRRYAMDPARKSHRPVPGPIVELVRRLLAERKVEQAS